MQSIVNKQYKVNKRIGQGSFGIIYKGIDLFNNQPVAIKFESKQCNVPQLKDEYESYKLLSDLVSKVGVPKVYYFGEDSLHSILVLDLLGPSLESLFDICERKFSIKTVAMLAIQMITLLQAVHEKDMIYRDIKPDNFLIGRTNENSIFIVDFGMAKLFRDKKTGQHMPYRERKSLSGTARYMSINTHLGREQSRRDDLESLGHVFMYFLRGSLPWQGLNLQTNKQKYEKIAEIKQSIGIHELCEGYPKQFIKYMHYCRKLGFEETPDYDWLRHLFMDVLSDLNEMNDNIFDWMSLNKGYQQLLKEKKSTKQLLLPAPPTIPDHQIKDLSNTNKSIVTCNP